MVRGNVQGDRQSIFFCFLDSANFSRSFSFCRWIIFVVPVIISFRKEQDKEREREDFGEFRRGCSSCCLFDERDERTYQVISRLFCHLPFGARIECPK